MERGLGSEIAYSYQWQVLKRLLEAYLVMATLNFDEVVKRTESLSGNGREKEFVSR